MCLLDDGVPTDCNAGIAKGHSYQRLLALRQRGASQPGGDPPSLGAQTLLGLKVALTSTQNPGGQTRRRTRRLSTSENANLAKVCYARMSYTLTPSHSNGDG
ncbi:hypothetical protein M5G07_08125 [Serratia symbiotica]|nr:hypothetical protein [Serratia symbiotica]